MEDEPEIALRTYHTLRTIQRDYAPKPSNLPDVCGIWLWGPSGSGKSYMAREISRDHFYLKPANKWWDGYQNEDFVIIEDFDRVHHVLGHHMKLWADRYAFTAEVKGNSFSYRPKCVIVTSNWHPSEIWGGERQTLDPILRRFHIKKVVRRTVVEEEKWDSERDESVLTQTNVGTASVASNFVLPPPVQNQCVVCGDVCICDL